MRSRQFSDGKMLAKCAPQRSAVAICRRYASPSAWRWRYIDAMRSPTSNSGKFFASCIPEGASDGKSAPPWQHIAAMRPKRAGFGNIRAPCIRKAPQIAAGGYTTRISCQGGALFAALTPRIMHGAQILPRFSARKVLRVKGWSSWVVQACFALRPTAPRRDRQAAHQRRPSPSGPRTPAAGGPASRDEAPHQ